MAIVCYTAGMETRFNKQVQKHRRRWLPDNWQEKLPIKPALYVLVMLLGVLLAIVVNQPADGYLNNAEIDVLRREGSLKVAVDENLYGMNINGKGLEPELCAALSREIFGNSEGCQMVPLNRHTLTWQMSEGNVDIAIMSLVSLPGKSYVTGENPFYQDPCLIMGYHIPRREELGGVSLGVLYNSPAYEVLSQYQQDVENGLGIVTFAAYYDMMVALRAGSLDGVCMPRTVALTFREKGMNLSGYHLGTIDYHAVGTAEQRDLMALVDSLLVRWAKDGTLRGMYENNDLLYEAG